MDPLLDVDSSVTGFVFKCDSLQAWSVGVIDTYSQMRRKISGRGQIFRDFESRWSALLVGHVWGARLCR